MRQPDVYSATEICIWPNSIKTDDGRWIPARPEGHSMRPLSYRIKTAWRVFTGELDALEWTEQA